MVRSPATVPDDAVDDTGLARACRITIGVLVLVAVGSRAIGARSNHAVPSGERWFLLVSSLLFALVVYMFGLVPSSPTLRPAPWAAITGVIGLAAAALAAALAQGDSPHTDGEGEVLAAAASRDAIADIAARLQLSPGTVRNHLSAAIQKLGARNRGEAAQIAQQKGWL